MVTASSLKPGTHLTDQPFAVTHLTEKLTRNNTPYLQLTLTDQTGQIEAKVWQNSLNNVAFELGKVALVSGKVEEHQGKISLIVSKAAISPDQDFANYLSSVPTLIFDIETVGTPFDELAEWDQDYFLNKIETNTDPEEAKTKTGLCSIYGFIQAIGIIDQESRGLVLTLTNQNLQPENKRFTYHRFKTEKKLLEKFWELTQDCHRFVTYNGRGFDFPFLIIRSGINRVRVPLEIDHRNQTRFVDLAEHLKQGGRQFKLEALCRAFGITNPKEKGVSGLHVTELYHQNNHQAIADYVARDVTSTQELYDIWRQYLSGHLNF